MTDLSAVEAVFSAAVALRDPAARAAYLDRACRADSALRGQVERLLAAHPGLGHFLDPPTPPANAETVGYEPASAGTAEPPGTVLDGRYKLLEVIGEGGMGSVWMAQQTEPVKRLVAVKLVKAGLDSAVVLARFDAERQALALMDHPNIARVFDGGATAAGRPYFVMELVRGVPITRYCDGLKLPPRARLALFADVCRAVQHAHTKGVIHRDLKPSNVLVALYDEKPVPKVIDFGIAKAAGQPLTDKTLVTGFGAVVGTPEYMSPEQATLNQLDIDTRSDVYSLGVLLYELLAGSPPFPRDELGRVGLLEVLRVVREVDPPKPSTRLSSAAGAALAADRGVRPKELAAQVRGELDWVVMKALEKDRNRRYETAAGLAADVERYLAGDAVAAAPPSAAYRLRKLARRNRAALAAGLAVAVALAAGTGAATWQAVRATRAEGRAEARYAQARQAVDEMYTQVAEKWLSQRGDLTDVQRQFLEKALASYEGFAAEAGADPEARYEVVRALSRVGAIQTRLRRQPEAEATFRRAIDLSGDLVRERPGRPEFLLELPFARAMLATQLRLAGREAEAEGEAVRAYREVQALLPAGPADPRYRRRLADALRPLCNELVVNFHLTSPGRLDMADTVAGSMVDVWEGLAKEFPSDPEYRYGVAAAHEMRGRQRMWWGGRNKEAEASFREADAHLSALLADRPGDTRARRTLADALANLGVILVWEKRDGEQEAVDRRVLSLREGLAAEFPNEPTDQEGLAITVSNLGRKLGVKGRSLEAADHARKALAIYNRLAERHPHDLMTLNSSLIEGTRLGEQLLRGGKRDEGRRALEQSALRAKTFWKTRPEHGDFRFRVYEAATELARSFAEQGDHAGAARALSDLPPSPVRDEPVLQFVDRSQVRLPFAAGRLLLACATLAEQDAAIPPTEREGVARTHRASAAPKLGDADRAAEDWARKLLSENTPGGPGLPVAWSAVAFGEELLREDQSAWSSTLEREIAVGADHVSVKALIRDAGRRSPAADLGLVADLLSTAPEAARDPESGLTLARRAVESKPADPLPKQSLGWALYRAGDWAGCVETLTKSVGRTSESDFVLAMAQWRLGNRDEARTLYRRGDESLPGYERRVEERRRTQNKATHPPPSMLKRLRAEAAALLEGRDPARETAPPPRDDAGPR